ncbi:ABC transporter ATP-binding protein [Pseudonocardia cypriaca]|uniref:ABC-type multidrug transport system fused ATPase/permease subunit n=1 Tax=Pseudonocardia cypriaca TaxID=882449 RepID=A0A543GGS7_9PSEU|nr:ABC transporter ATP-binding protein [Pseudonocardia cypriaca]TQM45281.1 ABC-type multidrug transport system fused ATPase/permease subunit [Pseudonocardia cypriaca]
MNESAQGYRAQPLTWRRLAGPTAVVVGAMVVVAAVAETAGAVVAGRVAESPGVGLVWLLGALLVGATILDTAGRTAFSGVIGRAEGRLRADLLHAALHQPLPVLEEQAVGEMLDRVDDDARQLGALMRRTGWQLSHAALRSVLAWVVAGLTWWPAWFAFPVVALLAAALVRPLTAVVAERKLAEEAAWSDHSAQLEEAVAGRDDVRSSLGQPHVVRQYAVRAREVLQRVAATCAASTRVGLRAGLVLSGMLAALAVAGAALVSGGGLGVAELVTLWLLFTTFAGQLNHISMQMPEVQAGLGALQRIRSLLAAQQEPVGGRPVPAGPAAVEVRDLTFGYPGGFALRSVHLTVPAGTTCALVGRTGAGKSTLAKLLSRAVEPPPGTVFLAGQDVTATDLHDLRRAVGVVTQRTEILAATLEENITLFADDVPPAAVEAAVDALGLAEWVAALPDGLQTRLGAGGTTLSAGEEQLVAFARLLVRDVAVVVLDEATARMDPQTERRVTRAADRLLAGRTGILVAHRLSTTRRCHAVAVLDRGRVVQHGERARLAAEPGPFRDLLAAAGDGEPAAEHAARFTPAVRRPPKPAPPAVRARLARTVVRTMFAHPRWGVLGGFAFLVASLLGAYGAVTGWLWGRLVGTLEQGGSPWDETAALAATLLFAPLTLAVAFRTYPLWWSAVTLRTRLAVLRGQTMQRRLARTPAGEVVARALDSDRLVLYVDRWVDVTNGVVVVLVTAVAAQSLLAGAVLGTVLVVSAAVSAVGAPLAGSSARVAGDARARFGGALVSVLDAARTVKLAAATEAVQAYLGRVDERRVAATVREQRVRMLLEGAPALLTQLGVVAAWAVHLAGTWDLATALLVSTAVAGSGWFGMVFGAAVTEAPVARRWLQAMADLAGDADIIRVPPGVDLPTGAAPAPEPAGRVPLKRLSLDRVTAVHDDGTVGVQDVSLAVDAGSLVLLTGRVGSGKSSLLASLAGLVDHEGSIRWNDLEVDDPELFLRPGQVAYVGQVPRVLSGSFSDNIALDHDRRLQDALDDARLEADVEDAGGHGALIGHRGVRLSGGQVQRLALARALATEAELLVADDVSSALDARTEVELWEALRRRGVTVVGCSSKRSALARADCVVVLEDGRVAATGTWSELAGRWGHLAG